MTTTSEKHNTAGTASRTPSSVTAIETALAVLFTATAHSFCIAVLFYSSYVSDREIGDAVALLAFGFGEVTGIALSGMCCDIRPWPRGLCMFLCGASSAATATGVILARDIWPITGLGMAEHDIYFGEALALVAISYWGGFALEGRYDLFHRLTYVVAYWIKEEQTRESMA
ncbi:hypothetical protein GGS26DRAFT_592550 [Hypomontagnella submonticulosa]|nr:hypothetical protein GGS26DRAFT_592550 [Hypomontagnella submonticulosa]